jgi:hypothetical protein
METSWKIAIRLFMSLYLPSLIDVGGVVAIRVVHKSRENTRIWSRCKGEAGRGRELLCNIEVLISRNRGRCRASLLKLNSRMLLKRADVGNPKDKETTVPIWGELLVGGISFSLHRC